VDPKDIKMFKIQESRSLEENLTIIKRISQLKARVQKNIKTKGEKENE